MGATEEVGKAVSGAVDTFRGNALCLAAIVLAAFFGALTFYGLQRDADRRQAAMLQIMDRCFPDDEPPAADNP